MLTEPEIRSALAISSTYAPSWRIFEVDKGFENKWVSDDVDGASNQSAGVRNHSERGESRRDKGTGRKYKVYNSRFQSQLCG
jgi:hypothetical protein